MSALNPQTVPPPAPVQKEVTSAGRTILAGIGASLAFDPPKTPVIPLLLAPAIAP